MICLFRKNQLAFFSSGVLILFVLVAVFANWLAPYSFSHVHSEFLKIPPAFLKGGDARFLLGTDDLGRDFLSRLIYGTRISMGLSCVVVFLAALIGASLGLLSGYLGGRVDAFMRAVVDILMSFPSILLAIIVVAILGPGLFNTAIAVTVMALPAFIRIMRGEILKEKNKDYAEAIRSFGANPLRVVFRHILPNTSGPLIIQSALAFSESILNIAALGFLGLGAQAPLPEWGTMISDGRDLMTHAWWLVVCPGICILMLVLCFNILGNSLRDILDPKHI